ncbi:hypothetical protein D018_1583B, partial [Vibrio parahaemolyticus VP2007-007]
IVIPYSFTR